jgi:hypothetical protein
VGEQPKSRATRAREFLEKPTTNLAEQDARRVWQEVDSADPRDSLQVIGQALGHGKLAVETTLSGARWFSWCICGWVSTTRLTETDAASAAVHHVRLAMKEWTRSGLPLAAAKKAPEGDWEKVARKHRHWAEKRRHADPPIDVPHLSRATG